MENSDSKINLDKEPDLQWKHHDNGLAKIFAGLVIVAAGVLLMVRKMGFEVPYWIFSWSTLLVVIGLYIGIKHSFRRWFWLIPFLIGSFHLANHVFFDFSFSQFIFPLGIIILGFYVMLKPKRKFDKKKWFAKWEKYKDCDYAKYNSDDYIDSVAVFSGIKKNIISKDFKGGEITNFFGGTEINLSQADIQGKVSLEISQVFGGTKLIIPSHWELKSELTALFGGIEDKRPLNSNLNIDNSKVLILRGTTVMGGIEIKSY
jgi:predicted membrane protein